MAATAQTFARPSQPASIKSPTTPYYYSQNQPGYPQGNFTPPNTSTTPPSSTNISPTSSHVHVRHVNPPKQCFYIPAVLRPTDMPVKRNRPLTPPRSANSSMDSSKGSGTTFTIGSSLPVSPAEDRNGFFGAPTGVSRVVSDEWSDEPLGDVTGQPTKNHWKPDTSASCCASPTCTTFFSFLSRRHHCRRCGNIFCQPHSNHEVPIDQEARFHPQGNRHRVCDTCFSDFKQWRSIRNSRASSVASSETAKASTPGSIAMPGSKEMGPTDPGGNNNKDQKVGSVAASVPRDWNWSTF